MVHLHQLKLASGGKLLFDQGLFLARMSLLDFVELLHKTLFGFRSLLCSCLFDLVGEFEKFLGVVRLQAFLVVLQILDLIPQSLHLQPDLPIGGVLLQVADLLFGLRLFYSHLGVHQFLLEHLNAGGLVLLLGLQLCDCCFLLVKLGLHQSLTREALSEKFIHSFGGSDLDLLR